MERHPQRRRVALLDIEDLRAILRHASWHLRIAIAVGLLAPKLRLANILALDFKTHFSPDLTWLTVDEYKTSGYTGKPLVAYVPAQLRRILQHARDHAATRRSSRVVLYRGAPIKDLRDAVRGAMTRAAVERPTLTYGRAVGVTFHTLRHVAATTLAEQRTAPDDRQSVMGHQDIASTLWYTHLRPTPNAGDFAQVSEHR